MHYTVYKTTNIINGKFYIGKHKTSDPYDDYLGSGKLLNKAIKKYGRENFVKEVLCDYDNEAMMNLAEKILVVIDPEVSYNICKGGHGGFGYINEQGLKLSYKFTENDLKFAAKRTKEVHKNKDFLERKFQKWRNTCKLNNSLLGANNSFYGKNHTEETKKKISEGNKNKIPWNKGKQRSEETKRKISDTLKAKKLMDP